MKKWLILSLAFAAFAVVGMGPNNTYASTGCIGSGTSCNTTTTVQVQILPGNMCIGSTGDFNFGIFTASSTAQTISGAFVGSGGYFHVDDLKGADAGYYTTIQVGNLSGPGISKLGSGNIFMKTALQGNAGITTMAGAANTNVQVQTAMSAFQSLDAPRQLIIRNNAANSGIIGQYGVLPQLQLVIPAYQAVGIYTGTLTYTLYSN